MQTISIHVPRAGYDFLKPAYLREEKDFYPRTPCGVRQELVEADRQDRIISIHVPRAGYDCQKHFCPLCNGISIHVPRAGYDRPVCSQRVASAKFLSTYPVRGTTLVLLTLLQITPVFLSTYPVRGTTYAYTEELARNEAISIHVPRAGYDAP